MLVEAKLFCKIIGIRLSAFAGGYSITKPPFRAIKLDAGNPNEYTYTKAAATPSEATTSVSGPTPSSARFHRIMLRNIFWFDALKRLTSCSSLPYALTTRIPLNASCMITPMAPASASSSAPARRTFLLTNTTGIMHSGNNNIAIRVNFQSK